MSEATTEPHGYNANHFPFAAIFQQLTQELQDHPAGPLSAYVRYQYLRRQSNLRAGADYCSTSITSSGHARHIGLDIEQIIAKNTEAAQRLVAQLVGKGTLHPKSVIVPVDLGYIPGWRQSDYISFWLAIIAGFDLGLRPRAGKVKQLEDRIFAGLLADNINLGLMNSQTANTVTRAPEYFKFARTFARVAANFQPEAHGSHRIINLIDPQDSLGCQTERLFAKLRGIPVYSVGVTGPSKTASAAFTDHTLYEDLETIVRYGGTSVEFVGQDTFILRHEESVLA
jgi:hypothetical protein